MILNSRQAERLDHLFKQAGRTGSKMSLSRIANELDIPEHDVRVIRAVVRTPGFSLHVSRPNVRAIVELIDDSEYPFEYLEAL